MGAVKHAVRVVNDGGFAVPVPRQPRLVVGYEHFRLERQGALLSPKTLTYYHETVLPFLRWLELEGVRRFHSRSNPAPITFPTGRNEIKIGRLM